MSGQKFIRVHGHVVPVKDKGPTGNAKTRPQKAANNTKAAQKSSRQGAKFGAVAGFGISAAVAGGMTGNKLLGKAGALIAAAGLGGAAAKTAQTISRAHAASKFRKKK